MADEKVGRNDPCPCGSGLKHKKCCWNKYARGNFKASHMTSMLQSGGLNKDISKASFVDMFSKLGKMNKTLAEVQNEAAEINLQKDESGSGSIREKIMKSKPSHTSEGESEVKSDPEPTEESD